MNDTFGHEVGDAVIIRTGTRLQAHVNGFGYAARTGGEEFTVVMIGTPYGLRKRIATLPPKAVVNASDDPPWPRSASAQRRYLSSHIRKSSITTSSPEQSLRPII